jgi:hypothetical protein
VDENGNIIGLYVGSGTGRQGIFGRWVVYDKARKSKTPRVLKGVSGPWSGRESLVEATPSLKSIVHFYSCTIHEKYIQRTVLAIPLSGRKTLTEASPSSLETLSSATNETTHLRAIYRA